MATFESTIGSRLTAGALPIEGVRNVCNPVGDRMADAWGRIAGQPRVALYTSAHTSAWFANAIQGLAGAFHPGSSSPFISGCADQTVQRRR